MIRLMVVAGVVALAVVVLGPLRAPLALWEVVVAAAAVALVWGRLPEAPERVPSLLADPLQFGRSSRSALGSIGLEVAGATDPKMGGDPRVRLRLLELLRHRAGLGPDPIPDAEGRRLLGDESWHVLRAEGRVISPTELDELVRRIERL